MTPGFIASRCVCPGCRQPTTILVIVETIEGADTRRLSSIRLCDEHHAEMERGEYLLADAQRDAATAERVSRLILEAVAGADAVRRLCADEAAVEECAARFGYQPTLIRSIADAPMLKMLWEEKA